MRSSCQWSLVAFQMIIGGCHNNHWKWSISYFTSLDDQRQCIFTWRSPSTIKWNPSNGKHTLAWRHMFQEAMWTCLRIRIGESWGETLVEMIHLDVVFSRIILSIQEGQRHRNCCITDILPSTYLFSSWKRSVLCQQFPLRPLHTAHWHCSNVCYVKGQCAATTMCSVGACQALFPLHSAA